MSAAVASSHQTTVRPGEIQPNALVQNIWLKIFNLMSDGNITLKNAQLSWGKFVRAPNDFDNPIEASEVENEVATPGRGGTPARVNACGKESASSGTEGTVDLYDGSTRICTVYWDCPWKQDPNKLKAQNTHPNYMVQVGDYNDTTHGTIGNAEIRVVRMS